MLDLFFKFWLGAAALAIVLKIIELAVVGRRPTRKVAPHSALEHEESKPDNPRFATWDEAFNRRVTDDLRFKIEYADKDGVVTERTIRPISIHLTRGQPDVHIKAHCELRGEERTFFSGRILSCVNLQTNRPLRDLGQYLRGRF